MGHLGLTPVIFGFGQEQNFHLISSNNMYIILCEVLLCFMIIPFLIFFQHSRTALHTASDENEDTNVIALILKCEGVDVNATDGVRGYVVSLLVCLSQVQDYM